MLKLKRLERRNNNWSVVGYVPFDSDTIGNQALDLSDVLRFKGGQADANRISAITSMQCKIGGKQTLQVKQNNPSKVQVCALEGIVFYGWFIACDGKQWYNVSLYID